MNIRPPRIALWLLLLLLLASGLQAEVIKIGSIAPARSIWDNALNDLSAQWAKITGGAVQLKVYPGGIVGNEEDMLTKMRLGTLGGAVFTNIGMSDIYSDAVVLNTPFLMDTDEEFNFVFDRLKPRLEQHVEEKGFKVIFWTLIGWEYFFTKNPVLYPEDMKKEKLSYSTSGTELAHAWRKMGYQLISVDLRDLLMALQSGMNTAFYLPPLMAASGQFFALAPHMLNLRLAPIVGSLILTTRAWNSIPERFRQPMLQAIDPIAARLHQQTLDLDKEALKTMADNGLTIHQPPAGAPVKWKEVASLGMDELVGKAFSKEIYDEVQTSLREYRQKLGK
jgi:TRAP-type C4-dicarboxylate transport system substrate-binding protein